MAKKMITADEWKEMATEALDNWDIEEMSDAEIRTLEYWAMGDGVADTDAAADYADKWDWLAECCKATAATW